jgi:hypothetical protein
MPLPSGADSGLTIHGPQFVADCLDNGGARDCVMELEAANPNGGGFSYRLSRAYERSLDSESRGAESGEYATRDDVILALGHQMEAFMPPFSKSSGK